MRNAILLVTLLIVALPGHAQQSIETQHFSPAQKAEWDVFIEDYSGGGNGTCFPIMEEQIRKGQCSKFDFVVDLHVGSNGRIRKVTVRESKIRCVDKAVEKRLLKCFVDALADVYYKPSLDQLKNRIIRSVEL